MHKTRFVLIAQNCFVQLQLIAQNLFCPISLPLEEALLHKTLCLRISLDGASLCRKCINSLYWLYLNELFQKSIAHGICVKKHSTIQDWLFFPWPHVKFTLNWYYVDINTASDLFSRNSNKKIKELKEMVLCIKLLLHKTGFVQWALPEKILLHTSQIFVALLYFLPKYSLLDLVFGTFFGPLIFVFF